MEKKYFESAITGTRLPDNMLGHLEAFGQGMVGTAVMTGISAGFWYGTQNVDSGHDELLFVIGKYAALYPMAIYCGLSALACAGYTIVEFYKIGNYTKDFLKERIKSRGKNGRE